MADLSQARVRKLFNYRAEIGDLIWCSRPESDFVSIAQCKTWNTRYAGAKAGTFSPTLNSVVISINGKSYRAHRLIWFWNYGVWPDQIDHINGNGNDNRLANLRDVTCAENHKNMPVPENSKTGILGVRFHHDGAWVAEIKAGDRYIHLGSFSDIRMATAARKAAEKVLGYHENHGRPSNMDDRRSA